MSNEQFSPPESTARNASNRSDLIHGRVTVRTLVYTRWLALIGQLVAIVFVHFGMGLDLPLALVLATVAASGATSIIAWVRRGSGARLGDRTVGSFLAFDILQLSLLLFLTGGLGNPFAILILAPVTVAATILSRQTVFILLALALFCVAGLSQWHLPLPWPQPGLQFPGLYTLGLWVALSVALVFIGVYTWSVARESQRLSDALAASQMALAREQRISALGALAAAAAHELGSPLGTIAIVAKELARDVPDDSPWHEDVQLLMSQTARCREILAELSRQPEVGGDAPFDFPDLRALIDSAAAPHLQPHIDLDIVTADTAEGAMPITRRTPELMHGLGNLLQNAIQFAERKVTVALDWSPNIVSVTILDDGPGFPAGLLDRVGEPYISQRAAGGEHLGLGIFIAQTLLERTGARIRFSNSARRGAKVVIIWNRSSFDSA